MTRQIIVLGNCQVGGIAAALQRIYWADEVQAVPLNPAGKVERGAPFFKQIADADLVFGSKSLEALLREKGKLPPNFVSVPAIYFSAFHPDVVRARAGTEKRFSYNSAICAWAFNRGLEPAQALRLYTRRTFAELGYFERWDASVAHQRAAFESAGLPFDRFFLAVKRLGAFMHTVNHPNATVLAYLAKTLALAAGHEDSIWNREIVINDALSRVESWGVYPEVARELAVHGSYSWLVERGTLIEGLENYVEHAYRRYTEAGVQRGQLQMVGVNPQAYDAILSSAFERS
jgi:hypothetical protein